MLRILLVALLAFGAYKFHQNGYTFSGSEAFDKDGKPLVVLFVGPQCEGTEVCERVRQTLVKRGVKYEEIDVAGPDGQPIPNKYGVDQYPTTLVGKRKVFGDDIDEVRSVLAEAFGKDVLTRGEQMAMNGHFDADGRPKVVMYGTQWCGYCKKQRELFADKGVRFDDVDVEASDAGKLAYSALQGSGYPLTYVGYRRFGGFQEQALLEAIDELATTRQANVR